MSDDGGLLPAHRILHAANRVANLSTSFLGLASCLQLPVADGLSGDFFDLALGLLS
jgi:hypothetical protein